MKSLKPISLLLLAMLLVAGCAGTKKGEAGSEGATEDYATSKPLPPRPNINPDTDVDYSTLKTDTVYFAFDSYIIQATERGKLARVADWMKENPARALLLAGHTDKRGTLEYNRGLGERRAQAVRDYLIGLGVSGSRLNTISYGQERPVNTGTTEMAYAQNRRVEVGVINK